MTVGSEEWLSLPELGVPAIKAAMNKGAVMSSLHAHAVERYGRNRSKVHFLIRPVPERQDVMLTCTAPLVDQREMPDENGRFERRCIIQSPVRLGAREWPVELALTERETADCQLLLGAPALQRGVVVDPFRTFLQGNPPLDLYVDRPPANDEERRAMHIALLTREPDNYSSLRIVEAASARGHKVDMIDTARCVINIASGRPEVRYDGKVLPLYDAVIPRIGASITFYGMAVVRQFEMMGVHCQNPSYAIGASRDKLFAHQLLGQGGLGMPVTGIANSPKDTDELLKIVGGAPMVLKLLEGTQGKGVVLAETKTAAESVMDAFRGLKVNILVQEFVAEAKGTDIRCFVVGGKVVAAMMRKAVDEEFRSNLHQGGKALPVKISKEERQTAVRAAKVMGLRVAGVDMLRTKDGPKVLEVNSSPGLEGIESVSGVDIAGLMIDDLERQARPFIYQLKRHKP